MPQIRVFNDKGVTERLVPGEIVSDYLAITPAGVPHRKGLYTVTHIPTGSAIIAGLIDHDARLAASQLARYPGWGAITHVSQARADKVLVALIQSVREQFQGESHGT